MNYPQETVTVGAPERFRTLSDAVYDRLRKDLLSGKLAPGVKLRLENLRATYSVGMSPLREALFRLEPEGLVIGEGQRGFRVAPVSIEDLWDVTRLRIELECKALRESIAKGGNDWEVEIVASAHRLFKSRQTANGDYEDIAAAHRQFHRSVVAACGSPWNLHFISVLYDHSERYRRMSVQQAPAPRDLENEHRALVDACLARDADQACALLEEHLVRTAKIVTRLPLFEAAPSEPADSLQVKQIPMIKDAPARAVRAIKRKRSKVKVAS
jgi:GntR family transcriptional regulator, carbon starvation induced regulator